MAQHYGPNIVTDGLVLCLDAADKNSYPGSGTTVSDLSGNNNSLTLSTAAIGTDNSGTLTYASSRTSDLSSTLISDGESFMMSMWVYMTSDSARGGIFQRKNDSPYNGISFGKGGGGGAYGDIRDASSNAITIGLTQYLNTWVEYALRFNAATKTLDGFENGALVSSDTNASFTNTLGSNQQNLAIGWRPPSSYFIGQLACIKIYNRALTAAEVSQNFNAQRSRFGV